MACLRSPSQTHGKIDNSGLIAESKGHFDAAEYERGLRG
jgi:hypothetical protein